jgi:Holliday junction resolvasome RuvABC endonuclease subunit
MSDLAVILALDLASETGWALGHDGQIESGVVDFTPVRGESAGMRYVRFNAWLDTMLRSVTLVIYEAGSFHRGGPATELAYGLSTRVIEAATRHKIIHTSVNVSTLKKWLTHDGRADKAAVVSAVNRRFRIGQPPIENDNEADALGLLHYALDHWVEPSERGIS